MLPLSTPTSLVTQGESLAAFWVYPLPDTGKRKTPTRDESERFLRPSPERTEVLEAAELAETLTSAFFRLQATFPYTSFPTMPATRRRQEPPLFV